MKKAIIFPLFLLAFAISGCNQDDDVIDDLQLELQNACTAEDPLELEWMQDFVETLECGKYSCRVSIMKSTYNGESVFYELMTDPLCNGVNEIKLYDCYGNVIKEFNIDESSKFINSYGNEAEEIFSCNNASEIGE